jgi:hypothetical protein
VSPPAGSLSLDALAESPYRVRGSLYLGTRSYFEHHVRGGFPALLSALRPALREFMAQPFRPRTFYEVMDCPELIDVEARVCELTVPRYLDRRTQWQAGRDLSGVAALILRLAPPSLVLARMAAVMTDTFNFGRPEVQKLDERCLRVEIAGVPQRLCAWLEHSVAVYGQACVEKSGRKNVQVRSLPPTRVTTDGTVNLVVDMRWG